MPNTKTAKKRLRQNVVRKQKNLSAKRALRTQLQKVRDAVEAGDAETAGSEFQTAVKKLDRAGSQNLIHSNAAARTKSRLSAKIKSLKKS